MNMCKNCPWVNKETCGKCRADRERRELDKQVRPEKKLAE